MNWKSKFFALACFLVSLVSISQNKVFLDERMQSIDSITYQKKCTFQGLKCLEYKTDSLIVYKVLYKYAFGKLEAETNNQIRQILSLDSKKTIGSNVTLLIKYVDTISDYASAKKFSDAHNKSHTASKNTVELKVDFKKKSNDKFHPELTLEKFNKNIEQYSKARNKCIKKFEKIQNVDVLHVYTHDKNPNGLYPEMDWIKDRNVLKTAFFEIMYNYNFVILKPNGDYFVSGSHLSDDAVKSLSKNNNWTIYNDDLKSTLDTYKINGVGIFKVYSPFDHKKHCF